MLSVFRAEEGGKKHFVDRALKAPRGLFTRDGDVSKSQGGYHSISPTLWTMPRLLLGDCGRWCHRGGLGFMSTRKTGVGTRMALGKAGEWRGGGEVGWGVGVQL